MMNNTISNNVAFGAKLTSNLGRRPRIIGVMKKEFAKKTENFEIPMNMFSGGQEYPGAVFFELIDKVPTSFCITNANERLFLNKKSLTMPELNNATDFLVKVYKILREQKVFTQSTEGVNANIFSAKKAKYANERLLAKAEAKKNANLIKTYQTLVKSNGMRIETLNKEKEKAKDAYLSKMQFIAGEDKQLQEFVKCERKCVD